MLTCQELDIRSATVFKFEFCPILSKYIYYVLYTIFIINSSIYCISLFFSQGVKLYIKIGYPVFITKALSHQYNFNLLVLFSFNHLIGWALYIYTHNWVITQLPVSNNL